MAGRKESGSVTRGFPVLFIITFHRTEKTWQIWMYKESGCGNVKSFRHSRLSWRYIWLEDTRKYLGISWRQKTIQPAFGWGNATHPPDIRIWGRAPSLPGQGQMQNHTTSLSLKNCTPFTSVSIRIGWIHPDGQFFRFWWISSNEHFIVYIIVNSFKSPLIVAALAGTEGFDLPQRGRRLAYLLTVARERGAVFIGF